MTYDRWPEPTYQCRCLDLGFIEHPDRTWHPCPDCRPVTYQRWVAGEYRPRTY